MNLDYPIETTISTLFSKGVLIIRARILGGNGRMYYGEVYGTWDDLFGGKEGWSKVTCACLTKTGVKYELRKWKQKHCPDEFVV